MVNFAHVGIQKTGSKFLQTGLFDRHPQLQVPPGQGRDHRYAGFRQLIQDLYEKKQFDQYTWLAQYDTLKTQYLTDDKTTGFSNEQLSGYLFDTDTGLKAADRLHGLFGQIKIILVVRHPVTYITSAYVETVKGGSNTRTLEAMLANERERHDVLRRVDYRVLIEHYHALFGAENLLLLPYELLRDSQADYLRYICEFLQIDPWQPDPNEKAPRKNEGLSAETASLLRQVNKVDLALETVLPKKTRLVSRSLRWAMIRNPMGRAFEKYPTFPLERLREYPGFAEQLRDENYQLWEGDLARFNYQFKK